MPKLDDYDDSQAPVSASAKSSITNKVTSGTSTLATPSAGFGTTSSGFGAVPPASTGFGGSGFSGAGASGFGAGSSTFGASSSSMSQTNSFSGTGQSNSNLTSTGGAMQEGGTTTIEASKGFGDFINSKWRPMMAVIYMITCCTDFVIFPVLWSVMQSLFHGSVTSQWSPLTLQGAGLYHIAMGAVLGLAAYGRSQEKIAGKA
jgi:hypothetical protein